MHAGRATGHRLGRRDPAWRHVRGTADATACRERL